MRGIIVILSTLLSLAVFAGTTVTVTSETWELRDGESHVLSKGYRTRTECETAGRTSPARYRCIGSVAFTVVGTCDDVPKPEMNLVTDAGGFLVLPKIKVTENADGTWGPTMEEGYVPAPYPACWVLGLVPYTGRWRAPERQPTTEAGPWIEGSDYPIGTPCPAEAHNNCAPYPNNPKTPPSECSPDACVSG